MALRLARSAAGKLLRDSLQHKSHIGTSTDTSTGAARLRPSVPLRTLPAVSSPIAVNRHASNVPAEEPKQKAQSIIDSLPGNSLVSKTAILSSGAALSIFAISNEVLVINEEAIVAFSLLSVFWAVGKYGGPMYKDWAEGQISKMKGILNSAREDHTRAVQDRIDNVKQLGSVIDVTKNLFEVSKVSRCGEHELVPGFADTRVAGNCEARSRGL